MPRPRTAVVEHVPGFPGAHSQGASLDALHANLQRAYFTGTHHVAERAGAAPLAALQQQRARTPERVPGRQVAVVLRGANVDAELFAPVLGGDA